MLEKLRTGRNNHVHLGYDAKTAIRRNQGLRRIQNAVNMHDYKEVFPQDKNLLFIYRAAPGITILPPYQVTILNLFSLQHIDCLNMPVERANDHID